ncbi:MAG: hypothetical protein JRE64_09640 [Deltaproteobacteria bacterium]|nr:hypothetical protein [Deltaproteobacteria bacterium]
MAIFCGRTRFKERGSWGRKRINIRGCPQLFAGLTEITAFMLHYKIKHRTAFTSSKIIVNPMVVMASHHSDLAIIFPSSKHSTRLAGLIAVKPVVAIRHRILHQVDLDFESLKFFHFVSSGKIEVFDVG